MKGIITLRAARWWVIGLVMLGALINYLTRSTLGVAAPTLMTDLQITEQQYGFITSAFQLGIMMQPFCGYVLDTLGLRTGFAIFAGAWSLITMAHGLAGSWPAFAALRGVLGIAEGSANPAGMKAVAEWFPAKERGFAGGFFNIGASVGSMLAPPLVAWAILTWNWRAAFVITGALGLVWVVLWLFLYRTPPRPAGEAGAVKVRPNIPAILRQRNFWGIALPRLLADPTWGTLAFWMPLYLTTVRGFDLGQIALFAWMPFLAADLGCLFGPLIAFFLQKRGVGLINARRCAFTVGALLMTGVAFVGLVDSPYLAVALLCLGGFAHQTLSVTVITMSSDLFPPSEVATVTGMAGTCGNLGVLVFSLMIGGMVATVGYAPFFVALAALDLVGAALLWLLVKPPTRDGYVQPVSQVAAAAP